MTRINAVGAIVTKNGITIYRQDGPPVDLSASRYETKKVLDTILPVCAKGRVAVVDIDEFSVHKRVEKKSGGLLRFFNRSVTAVKEALGLTDKDYFAGNSVETVVAEVNGVQIPGMEALDAQIEYAANNNAVGLTRFMERVAAVSKERGHTVQELLNFMRRGDLPIADDGSIIAYKLLYAKDSRFVDPHTRKVSQTVGSFVFMDTKLVDPSRRMQCSSGLHIARRNYLPSFSGDTLMLVKIAPEDVIAVPEREPDKMRVRGYHIVAKLDAEMMALARSNQPMTKNVEAQRLLADVVAGRHIGIIEHVEIGGAMGANVTITPVALDPAPVVEVKEVVPVKALDHDRKEREVIDPKAVIKAVQEAQSAPETAEEPAPAPETPAATTAAPAGSQELSERNATIISEWIANEKLPEGERLSKRKFSDKHGISPRQLGRILAKG